MKSLLVAYTQYNLWANLQLVPVLHSLDDEQINKSLGGSFTSIKDTCYHIWMAESVWLQRLKNVNPVILPHENYKGSFKSATDEWLQVSQEIIDYTSNLNDDNDDIIHYKLLNGQAMSSRLSICIHHCMNHSTFHRGQLVNYLRQLGLTNIPNTDFITYSRIHP